MSSDTTNNQIIYGLDDRPPPLRAVVLAAQHVLTMFGSTVAVPLIFGKELWPIPAGLPETVTQTLENAQLANVALLIASVMLCSGVATLLQSTFGSRLPIIQGVSFSFLAAFFGIVAAVQTASVPDWALVLAGDTSAQTLGPLVDQWQQAGALGMRTIAASIIFGGVIEATIGFTGLMGLVRRVLSPVVIGPVIMLIGLALYDAGAPVAASNWYVSGTTIIVIILFALILSRSVRLFKLFPMLLAIMVMVTGCYVLGLMGVIKSTDPAHVNLSAVELLPWVRTDTLIFPWGVPGVSELSMGAVIAVLAGYLASMIESFGDYHACKQMAGGGDPTPKEISRGIGFEGVACAITGMLGGFASTSYSENIGLIGLTKVGSRYVVQIGAVILLLLGLFGKFGGFAAAIPQPVVGGLYCALFGLIAAVGVRQFAKADLDSDRNLFIGGFILFMGISLPFYFKYAGGAQAVKAAMYPDVAGVVVSIGSTGMAVAAIFGLILDNLVPGTVAERGLKTPVVPSHSRLPATIAATCYLLLVPASLTLFGGDLGNPSAIKLCFAGVSFLMFLLLLKQPSVLALIFAILIFLVALMRFTLKPMGMVPEPSTSVVGSMIYLLVFRAGAAAILAATAFFAVLADRSNQRVSRKASDDGIES